VSALPQPQPPLATARLRPGRKQLVNAVGLGVWASGTLWLVFHTFLQVKGEFGPSPHPLEPWWLKLHGVFAFASLWTFGLLWGVHLVQGWSLHRRRWSGSVLFGGVLVLIVSGWLLYYVGSDTARPVVSVAHWAVGLAALPLYLLHRLARSRAVRTSGG
jgi:hypothetical protein